MPVDPTRRAEVPEQIAKSVQAWIGCVAGALEINEYKSLLAEAGFTSIDIEPTRVYRLEDARAFLSDSGIDLDSLPPEIDGAFISGFVRAVKPLTV